MVAAAPWLAAFIFDYISSWQNNQDMYRIGALLALWLCVASVIVAGVGVFRVRRTQRWVLIGIIVLTLVFAYYASIGYALTSYG